MGNKEFLIGRFRSYYKNADITLPPRFTRREYGFLFFDKKYMMRHISFKSKKEIKLFLLEKVPRHAYYSTAYYQDPGNKSMEEKKWMGADLIFDLDADHIPETESMSYREMLGVVKREAYRLVKDFILDDFGFDEDDIVITFSGGRGFHIYVRRDDVFPLKSDERREIVNYITGEGVDVLKFIQVEEGYYRRKKRKKYVLYPESAGGWYRKVTREIMHNNPTYLLELFEEFGNEGLFQEFNSVLQNKKLSKILTSEMLKKTKKNSIKLSYLASSKESTKLQILEDYPRDIYLQYIKNKISIKGETDEPVTTDIHRLIRFIGSIHGKTGFMVRMLSYDEFKNFNPSNPENLLNYVIPDEFKIHESKIVSKNKIELPFDVSALDGEDCVPDYVAVFAVARGMADFISKC